MPVRRICGNFLASVMVDMDEGKRARYAMRTMEMPASVDASELAMRFADLGMKHTSLRHAPGRRVLIVEGQARSRDFFHRAGMDETEVGSSGKNESQPDDVARQGIEALLSGKDHVYAASVKTKVEGMLANVTPGNVKGAMHEKMTRPKAS